MFASLVKLGRLPMSHPHVWKFFTGAAHKAGIGKLFNAHHAAYLPWLDAAGTPIAVSRKLMQHSDIRTTLNI